MKVLKRIFQGLGIFLLLIVIFLFVVKINGYIQLKEFYDNSTKEVMIPGLFENFIPQGMDFDKDKNTYIFSGYNSKDSQSTIYVLDSEEKATMLHLKNSKGEECFDHCGGVAIYKDYLLVSGGNGASTGNQFVYTFSLKDAYSAENGDYITSKAETNVHVGTAFIRAIGDVLYVGEFNHDSDARYNVQETTDRDWMPKDAKAMMVTYNLKADGTFDVTPTKAYTLPDDVQGMVRTTDGLTAFSQSYGLNPAQISFYKEPQAASNITIDGSSVPLYYFNDSMLHNTVKVSPMIEAIIYVNDKIYTLNESSSSKYMFGLLFRGSYVYSYDYKHE